jgi:prophage regulatory protein
MKRYLRLPEIVHKTGVSRSTIYKLMAKGEFPRARRLTSRTVGWGDAEIEAWMDTREAAPVKFGVHRGRRVCECLAKRIDPHD